MTNEYEEKSLPGYKGLSEQGKLNSVTLHQLVEVSKRIEAQMVLSVENLEAICDYKEKQDKNDCLWRGRWLEEKIKRNNERNIGHIKSMIITLIGMTLVYLEVTKSSDGSFILQCLKPLKSIF